MAAAQPVKVEVVQVRRTSAHDKSNDQGTPLPPMVYVDTILVPVVKFARLGLSIHTTEESARKSPGYTNLWVKRSTNTYTARPPRQNARIYDDVGDVISTALQKACVTPVDPTTAIVVGYAHVQFAYDVDSVALFMPAMELTSDFED